MKTNVAWLGLAALAASGCEHPVAGARVGAPAARATVIAVASVGEGEQTVLAHRTLQTLLREHAAAPEGGPGLDVVGSARMGPLATPAWLESQSALLRTLMGRADAAALAVQQADGQP